MSCVACENVGNCCWVRYLRPSTTKHRWYNDMQITIRVVTEEDRDAVLAVESQSTPNLKYLPMVFDQFLSDPEGDFSVAEMDGEVVGCGKFTVMPDGSAWLEALRVIPRAQGQGIGKAFYARFFEVAEGKGIKTMRMYTGMKNKVSKGLA